MPTALLPHIAEMAALGFAAAAIGSLGGLGGGFIVAPALRLIYDIPPDEAAATSLVLVLANVASASIAFFRQGRVDLRLALIAGTAAVPTSIFGALAVHGVDASGFDIAYAALLAIFAVSLFKRDDPSTRTAPPRLPWSRERTFTDRLAGVVYRYPESVPIEVGTGLTTGFLSSFFGIGGGTVVVPVLLRIFAMPAHIVSATSHSIILLSAAFGVGTHAFAGDIVWPDALPLAVGGLAGGQAGAWISGRMSDRILVRFVASVLAIAAISLFSQHALTVFGKR